ncbi:MAG: helix-turn-helix transcriptional regulator [Allosphingosinicella sp.]
MDQARIDRLTEQQRICLRHVYAHLTSKEIAPLMRIEPGSVDQHIKAAMRILGVGDRRTAARVLAEHEAAHGISHPTAAERVPAAAYQPLVYQSPGLVPTAVPGTFGLPIESGTQPSGRWSGEAMREEQASFTIVAPDGASAFPLPIGDRRPGDLGWVARLGWVAVIAIGVALAFGGLISGLEGLSALASH